MDHFNCISKTVIFVFCDHLATFFDPLSIFIIAQIMLRTGRGEQPVILVITITPCNTSNIRFLDNVIICIIFIMLFFLSGIDFIADAVGLIVSEP